jgi:CRISPR-associated protein (TIGR02584 family)
MNTWAWSEDVDKLAAGSGGAMPDDNAPMKSKDCQPTQMQRSCDRLVLLCATGLSPQVVTETVYALAHETGRRVPDEIHLVTTREGAERARLSLLSEEPGWFRRMRKDFDLPEVRFDESTIHVIKKADGTLLDDVRTAEDNAAAANAISELVRQLTADSAASLHVSIAGGRKTLGFFAGYALSLFGRPQDRLSHVLVSEPFEATPDFFYPTPYQRVINIGRLGERPVDCRDAIVTLADIPFVRLRSEITAGSLLNERRSYSEIVARIQASLTPSGIVLDCARRCVSVAGDEIQLKPAEFAFLWWVVRRQLEGRPVVRQTRGAESLADAREFLAAYQRSLLDPDETETPTHRRLKDGMDPDFCSERVSRIREAFRRALGQGRADQYAPRSSGRRGTAVYEVPIPLDAIVIK